MEYFLQIAANTVILAALYSLLALGFNFLYSVNKFFDLSYAAYLVLGSYTYFLVSKAHLPTLVTFFISLVVAVLFALVVEKFLYKHLRERKSSGSVMMIASLGTLTVAQATVALIFSSNIQTLSTGGEAIRWFGIAVTPVQLCLILGAAVAYGLTYVLLSRSRIGIQLRAIADNEELAITAGLPLQNVRTLATAAGVLIGVTGAILYGMDTSIDPYMGMQLLLKGTIVAIIGGLGSLMYGVSGAIVLATIENLAIWYIGGEWKDAIAFLLLIVILLWRPTGILKK